MFGKVKFIILILCMLFSLSSCTATGKQNDKVKESTSNKSAKPVNVESLKNTYWIAEQEDGDWRRTTEIFFYEDGSFHCRSITTSGFDPYCNHIDADTCTWKQNADIVDLEFNKNASHSKEVFSAQILNKGDKMRCYDMFEISDESLVFTKKDEIPKLSSIDEDSQRLIGEWELVSVDSNPPKNIATDYNSPFNSTLNIYKQKDKMYADYNIYRWVDCGKNEVYQIGISFVDSAMYPTCLNEFWHAHFDEPIITEDVTEKERINVKFTLIDDNKIILNEEHLENEYGDAVNLVYLRKGSKEYEDRENYFYKKTVTVSDVWELDKNLNDNTKIILKGGVYNLSDITERINIYDNIDYDVNANITNSLMYKNHIRLEAEEGANVTILTDSATSNVMELYGCGDITIKGITFGHNVEKGQCTGNVLSLVASHGIEIEDCNLFGCGTYGISSYNSFDINVNNTQIYECTYGLLEFNSSNNIYFQNCVLRDSEGFYQIEMNYSRNINFEDCKITNNKTSEYMNTFIALSSSHDIMFKKCDFKNNKYKIRNDNGVEFIDCTFNDNE